MNKIVLTLVPVIFFMGCGAPDAEGERENRQEQVSISDAPAVDPRADVQVIDGSKDWYRVELSEVVVNGRTCTLARSWQSVALDCEPTAPLQ